MDYLKFIQQYHLNNQVDLSTNIRNFYQQTNTMATYQHGLAVAAETQLLSENNQPQLYWAGLLHDISAFIPNNQRLNLAQQLQLPILPAEQQLPLLLHQKLSAYIAQTCFHITDNNMIAAIECHTTLKGQFTDSDLTLFLADKIAWDQPGTPPYLPELQQALATSKADAALVYLNYLRQNDLKVVHPWLIDAYQTLNTIAGRPASHSLKY
ncbi:HD domain-containing protein [Lapidilactobacillus wuchangensis]|uniref:HD domain-containing protein n=1 Tax=Lapidilactobacillus wuchangensis TaxID=2486001 RepID=UPI0013DE6C84|nr:HD domain-containing protein [Lapidilactobacillus wuchangensis]